MLTIRPITLKAANAYVAQNHRHNQPTSGHKWSIACYDGERLCGVAICGQPISRHQDDGRTIEARRVCTDGTHNACSKLYGACARIAKEFGYERIITYTLETESGASLRASGWTECGIGGGGDWNVPSRPREVVQMTLFGEIEKYPSCRKRRWEKTFEGGNNATPT